MTAAGKVGGGVCAPKGFRAAGVAAGIKAAPGDKDCALVASDVAATAAGTFTTNRFKSPPAQWSENVCRRGKARAVFVNSGNANACTGDQGASDTAVTAGQVGHGLGVASEEVCVLSTGVIGVPLPMARIAQGVQGCLDALSAASGRDAAQAIMTTDTAPKETAVEVALQGGAVRIGAIAKGAGMICPNMATMIALITTDAAIDAGPLAQTLREAVGVSFNRICVDNDMSTSDAVIVLANGASGLPSLTAGSKDFRAFAEGLREVCTEMAQALVRDGEGATKFVEIAVSGAATDADACAIARAAATSQLCKTAFFGEDPNWGRIACAVGYAGAAFEPGRVSIWIDDVLIMTNGAAAEFEEAEAAARMRKPEFTIRIEVGNGPGTGVYWTSDLSHGYVEINADYRT